THRDRGPGEEVGEAPAGVAPRGVRGVAILLLPHLVEAMHGAGGVGVVGEVGTGELEGPGRQGRVRRSAVYPLDPGVGYLARQSGAAREHERVIVVSEPVLGGRRVGQRTDPV